jgi:hypothetical protein
MNNTNCIFIFCEECTWDEDTPHCIHCPDFAAAPGALRMRVRMCTAVHVSGAGRAHGRVMRCDTCAFGPPLATLMAGVTEFSKK